MRYFLNVFILFLLSSTAFAESGIKGVVVFDGQKPKFNKLRMDGDAICLMHHQGKGDVYPETLVVNESNQLANVIIWVSNIPKKKYPAPEGPVVITQAGCNYAPHINIVYKGQVLKFLNPDGTMHNVHGLAKANKEFNVAMPKSRTEYEITFNTPEKPFPLKCDVHPWMNAWVMVVDNPFVAVSDAKGAFMINDLPAGEYTLEIWHERLGSKQMTVTLKENEVTSIDISLSKQK